MGQEGAVGGPRSEGGEGSGSEREEGGGADAYVWGWRRPEGSGRAWAARDHAEQMHTCRYTDPASVGCNGSHTHAHACALARTNTNMSKHAGGPCIKRAPHPTQAPHPRTSSVSSQRSSSQLRSSASRPSDSATATASSPDCALLLTASAVTAEGSTARAAHMGGGTTACLQPTAATCSQHSEGLS